MKAKKTVTKTVRKKRTSEVKKPRAPKARKRRTDGKNQLMQAWEKFAQLAAGDFPEELHLMTHMMNLVVARALGDRQRGAEELASVLIEGLTLARGLGMHIDLVEMAQMPVAPPQPKVASKELN